MKDEFWRKWQFWPKNVITQLFQRPYNLISILANPQKAPCVNVPEWFVKEGGELCLSDTENGLSIIRYWPKFLSEKGNTLMFKRLRKYCKWHQKQVNVNCSIPNNPQDSVRQFQKYIKFKKAYHKGSKRLILFIWFGWL